MTTSAKFTNFSSNINVLNSNTYERYYVLDFDTSTGFSGAVLASTLNSSYIHYKMYYAILNETIQEKKGYYVKILSMQAASDDAFTLDMFDLVSNINNSVGNRLITLQTDFSTYSSSGGVYYGMSQYDLKYESEQILTQIQNGNPLFIREIGERAFADITNLSGFTFDKYLRHIEPNAFLNTKIVGGLTLPTNVNFALSRDVFSNNPTLTKLTVPPNISVITSSSFYDTALEAVDMHFVTKIETRAFYDTNLSTIHISTNLKEIERDAFKLKDNIDNSTTYTYYIIFDQPIYEYENSTFTPTDLVNYDVIERNKLSDYMFYLEESNSYIFYVKNLPANSNNAWNNFFNDLNNTHSNVTVNYSYADTSLVLLPDSAHFTLDSNSSFFGTYVVNHDHYWTFENDYTVPNNVEFVVGKKSYDLTFVGGVPFTPVGSTIAETIYDTNNQGWSVSYPSPSTRPIDVSLAVDDVKMYIHPASSIVMDILQPITYTIHLTQPTVSYVSYNDLFHSNVTSGIINFTYSHYIEGVNPIYTLDSNNTLYYSDDYLILNPDSTKIGQAWSSGSTITQFPSDVFTNNIIDSRINFGIDGDQTYNIELYQDLSTNTRNYNSGYIENLYLSNVTCEYTGSSWLDRIIYSTGMNVPVLTWNGSFTINASCYADLTWDGDNRLLTTHTNHGGVVFDGNVYKDLNDQSLGGPMTIAIWARWDEFTNWSRLIDFGNGQGNQNILLGQFSDGTTKNFILNIRRGENDQHGKRIQAGTITLGQWTHVAFTVQGTDMRLFQDGVQVGINTDGHEPIKMTRTNHYVGKSNWSADALFKGSIYSLQIWNRALNPTEIYHLHSQSFFLQTSWNDASSVTLKLNNGDAICSFLHTPHLYMNNGSNDLYDYI